MLLFGRMGRIGRYASLIPSCSSRQDHLEFGAPVVHFVQYLWGFGEVEGDADADDSPSGR